MFTYTKLTLEEIEEMVTLGRDCDIAFCPSKKDPAKTSNVLSIKSFKKSKTYFYRFQRKTKIRECNSLRGKTLKYYLIEEE